MSPEVALAVGTFVAAVVLSGATVALFAIWQSTRPSWRIHCLGQDVDTPDFYERTTLSIPLVVDTRLLEPPKTNPPVNTRHGGWA